MIALTRFNEIISKYQISVGIVFPTILFQKIVAPDMSIDSDFFHGNVEHENLDLAEARLKAFQQATPDALLANGYLEQRAFYNTKAYERQINGTTEYRNIHLGTDFWIPAGTAIHTPFPGTVVISHDNDYHKDYGPTLVLEHRLEDTVFYTLYGHLSRQSLALSEKGKEVSQGEQIATLGTAEENGHWVPHLHFQVILDIMDNTENFNGVAYPSELEKWKALCPNPDLLFEETLPIGKNFIPSK